MSIFENFPAEMRLVLMVLCILALTVLAAWVVKRALDRVITATLTKHQSDQTSLRFVRRLVNLGIYVLGISAALTQVPEFQIIGHSLLAGAGILTVVGGLASQQVLSNVVSGFLIVFFRPFKINDRITVNNTFSGVVEDITLREIILRDLENNRVIVPNALVSSQVIVNANHIDERICKFIDIGVGYATDIDRALAIMVEEIMMHPLHIDGRTPEQQQKGDPVAVARVVSLGASSVNLRAWAWANNPADGFVMLCDLLQSIKKRFAADNIEIPFPQTTLSFAKDEVLKVSLITPVNHS